MSAAATLKATASTVAGLASAAIGWALVAPLAWMIPRRRDRIAVIGRDNGKFVDNAKYFYLQATASAPDLQLAFVTERPDVVALLRAQRCQVMRYPSVRGIWWLLRSGTIVVDSTEWYLRLRRFLVAGAKVVQLWHGVGFKRIELDKWRNEAAGRGWIALAAVQWARSARRIFQGRQVTYDLVGTTSRFYRDEVFAKAFRSRHFLAAGYPRNAFGTGDPQGDRVAWSNVDQAIAARVAEWLRQGKRPVLVAPTYRDSRATPLGLTPAVREALDAWCGRNGVELLFKFHPLERGAEEVRGLHFHLHPAEGDIYPLLPSMSALVTDYSSIYMDYLLVDRPVAFLVPDLEAYLELDRQIQFDFDEMTPGPKVASWEALANMLLEQWNADPWAGERAKLRRLAFDDLDQAGATQRLIDFMRANEWLPATASVEDAPLRAVARQ